MRLRRTYQKPTAINDGRVSKIWMQQNGSTLIIWIMRMISQPKGVFQMASPHPSNLLSIIPMTTRISWTPNHCLWTHFRLPLNRSNPSPLPLRPLLRTPLHHQRPSNLRCRFRKHHPRDLQKSGDGKKTTKKTSWAS